MSKIALILLEGSYLYYQKEVNYSQENFKLVHFPEIQSFHIYSEITSRVETGEFLKIMVRYEMNQHFYPVFMRLEKSLGNKYAQEIFAVDTTNQELKYSFQNSQSTQEIVRPFSSRHYLISPSFATSTVFTQSKKIDASGRTPINLLGTTNEWTFEAAPDEKVVFVEYKNRDLTDFKINNSQLPASQLALYEFDSTAARAEEPVDIFMSKFYGIPYQLIQGDHKIIIKNLKRNN